MASSSTRRSVQGIREIFKKYSSGHGVMNIDELLRFMTDQQKNSNVNRFMNDHQEDSNVNKEDAQKIINGLKHRNIFLRRYINFDGFLQYLLGDLNTPIPSEVHHDMDAPLSHYLLYTSHNSDSTGNQLKRASTIDTIIKALKRGVRVIDLDLWPNSNENSVDVCHGGTLTSPVDLKKYLLAIKDNAFLASEYPLLINFEDLQSLNPDLQDQVAKMVKQTFGEMLYYPDYSDKFPSPNNLKRKVLILTELPAKYLESQDTKNKFHSGNFCTLSAVPNKLEHIEEEEVKKAAPEFWQLIAMPTLKMKGGPKLWLSPYESRMNRLSISEQQLQDAINTHKNGIRGFARWNILTIHPNDQCFGSPNYNPSIGWYYGAQMVKLNMQGTGKYLSVMQGMFRANGGCGYVKKSDFLLDNQVKFAFSYNYGCSGGFNSLSSFDEWPPFPMLLKVTIYLVKGWNLDFRHIHRFFQPRAFCVKIRINGVPPDEQKEQTELAISSWVPEWNEEFEFQLRCPELAVLRIKNSYKYLREPDFLFAGQTCLPILELKRGIRAVPLCKKNGDRYKHTRLLMRFQF